MIKLAKMTGEQSFLPSVDLRYPLVKDKYSWDSTEGHDP